MSNRKTVDGSILVLAGMYGNPEFNEVNYQPQLVSRISSINSTFFKLSGGKAHN